MLAQGLSRDERGSVAVLAAMAFVAIAGAAALAIDFGHWTSKKQSLAAAADAGSLAGARELVMNVLSGRGESTSTERAKGVAVAYLKGRYRSGLRHRCRDVAALWRHCAAQ